MSLEKLDEPSLFTMRQNMHCAVLVEPVDGHIFREGEKYRLVLSGSHLLAVSGVQIIGRITDPPESVIHMMSYASPSAQGRVTGILGFGSHAELTLE